MSSGGRRFGKLGIVLRSMWSSGEGRYACVVLTLWLAVALISLVWTPHDLSKTDGYHVWQAPTWTHPLGTDGTGADTLSWLMAGSRTNLVISLLTVLVAVVLGLTLVGAMIARNRAASLLSVVVVDALICLPTVLIALILAVPFGAGIGVIVTACGIGYGLNLARIARPKAMLVVRSPYVESAVANGASGTRIFFDHVVPNILPVLLVQLSISAGTAVLAESGLTYLGVGVPPGTPSWGHSIATSVGFINVYPLTVIWPGLIVTLVVVALNIFGDVLRVAVDPLANPKLRESAGARKSQPVVRGEAQP